MIARKLGDELPFMATENVMMAAVQAGGDRQTLHEQIRVHSHAAGARLRAGAADNDLLQRMKNDPSFANVDIDAVADPSKFIGRAPEQVLAFIATEIEPIRKKYPQIRGVKREVRV